MNWIKKLFKRKKRLSEEAKATIRSGVMKYRERKAAIETERITGVTPFGVIQTTSEVEVTGPGAARDPIFRQSQPINCEECRWLGRKCAQCFVEDHSQTLKFEVGGGHD